MCVKYKYEYVLFILFDFKKRSFVTDLQQSYVKVYWNTSHDVKKVKYFRNVALNLELNALVVLSHVTS